MKQKGPWKLKKILLAMVTSIFLVVWFPYSLSACSFPAVYNFGDSNSDTGAASATFGWFHLPNGETFFGKPSGRVCDGRLIIDFIAENLGLPFLNAYLDSLQSYFQHGTNFAASGATIQPADGKLFEAGFSPISLNIQLMQFEQFKDRITELYNQAKTSKIKSILPRPEEFSKALYTLDCGQNDLHFELTSVKEEKVKESIPNIISQFVLAIKKLYQQGARNFWIHNTGPIGCLPCMVLKYPPKPDNADQNGCIKSYNEVAQEFNKQLKDKISGLRTQLHDAVLIYVDIYRAKYTLISGAEKYGFITPVEYCCGSSEDYDAICGEKALINGTEVDIAVCNDPSKYISWDNIHYTEAANHWVANRIIDGSFSDPPISLTNACVDPLLSRL